MSEKNIESNLGSGLSIRQDRRLVVICGDRPTEISDGLRALARESSKSLSVREIGAAMVAATEWTVLYCNGTEQPKANEGIKSLDTRLHEAKMITFGISSRFPGVKLRFDEDPVKPPDNIPELKRLFSHRIKLTETNSGICLIMNSDDRDKLVLTNPNMKARNSSVDRSNVGGYILRTSRQKDDVVIKGPSGKKTTSVSNVRNNWQTLPIFSRVVSG